MNKPTTREIVNEERPFQIEELFFSITDKRGVIEHCNEVFTRISGFTVPELIGTPHSILRHPDMPRVVFKLLWDTIATGQTIAAYVKNRAKDGRYYWVMAVVTPTENGYLSVRLKPSSNIFPIVRSVYAELLKVERAIEAEPKRRQEAMEASGARLLELLKSRGFKSYEAFMHTAMSAEMIARQKALPPVDPNLRFERLCSVGNANCQSTWQYREIARDFVELDQQLQSLFQSLDQFRSMNVMLLDKSRTMLDNAAVIRLLSLNATIAASQLGSRANTLGVVAESLGEASHLSEQVITEMSKEMDTLVDALSALIFEVAATKLQSEICTDFLAERLSGTSPIAEASIVESLVTLIAEVNRRSTGVYDQLSESERCFAVLRKRVEQLLRNVNCLRFVQFAGLKESIALPGADAFAVVFENAKQQIDKTRAECDQLCERVEASQTHIRSIRTSRAHVQTHALAMSHWASSLPNVLS